MDADTLMKLLPAVYRLRDDELAGLPGAAGPLRRLLTVLASQTAALDKDLDQLYDNLFVETCASWVLPYLAELVGASGAGTDTRSVVAHMVAYRRRKGTAAVLELLAHDITGWPARAVEFFRVLATTQNVNHVRLDAHSLLDVRHAGRLEFLGGPFESVEPGPPPQVQCNATGKRVGGRPNRLLGNPGHTVEVRTVTDRRGRYNIPHVGVFVWPMPAFPLHRSPAVEAFAGDRQRFLFNPLGIHIRLFNTPETEADYSSLAQPLQVPLPITRRFLLGHLTDCYPRSFEVEIATKNSDGEVTTEPIPKAATDIAVSELSDVGASWSRTPVKPNQVAIDPQRGRLIFATPLSKNEIPLVTFHYGFSGNLGGGEYCRDASFSDLGTVVHVANLVRAEEPFASARKTIQDGMSDLPSEGGVVEVLDNGRYGSSSEAPVSLTNLKYRRLELRAASACRPLLEWPGPLIEIEGTSDFTELTLNGLLILGASLKVRGIQRLRLRHCTLVPGLRLTSAGEPAAPDAPSLLVESAGTEVEIDHCVLGGLRTVRGTSLVMRNSVIDATSVDRIAFASPGLEMGGSLRVENCTIVGAVMAESLPLASNSIFLAERSSEPPVNVERRQEGCVRFCYLSPGAAVPRRHRCLPTTADNSVPSFVSLRYGDSGYARLSPRCAPAIRFGADDESELGVFHDLQLPRRERDLLARLDEYLRFGMEAGVFPVTYSASQPDGA